MLDAATVRRRFARAAASYAAASRVEAEAGVRLLERLAMMKVEPRRVLEAGCGPGRETAALARRFRDARILLVDFALPMLELARRAPGARPRLWRRPRAAAVCAVLERLPFAPASVELVWCNMVLHWLADPEPVLAEFARVLAPGGLLMLSTLGPDTLAELRAAAGEARVHRFYDVHEVGDRLLAAGFADPVAEVERITLVYADGEGLLSDLRASGQSCALAARARGLAGRGFLARLQSGLEKARGGGRFAVTYELVFAHGWKREPVRAARSERAPVRFHGARAGAKRGEIDA